MQGFKYQPKPPQILTCLSMINRLVKAPALKSSADLYQIHCMLWFVGRSKDVVRYFEIEGSIAL